MVVSRIANRNGRRYIEYNGKPYLMYGVQLRMDEAEELTPCSDWETNFSKAQELGFHSVMVPLRWRSFEPEEGCYAFRKLENYIGWADKYDLDVQLLWFGSNVCGRQKSVPAYILDDVETYPKLADGIYIDLSRTAILDREKQALSQVMSWLYRNDTNHRTSMLQIENEPDYGSGWQNQYVQCLRYLDELGRLVKESDYSVVTRVNITASENLKSNHVPEDILALNGIDMVGVDIYIKDTDFYDGWIEKLSTGDMAGNLAHIAEGGGQMEPLVRLIAHTFSHGAGYLIYELRTVRKNDYDFGVFRNSTEKWEYRDGTALAQYQWTAGEFIRENDTKALIAFNKAIHSLAEQIAVANKGEFRLLENAQAFWLDGCRGIWETTETGSGNFAVLLCGADGAHYFFSPADKAVLRFEDTVTVSVGCISGGKWNAETNRQLRFLETKQGVAYRLSRAMQQGG